MALLGGTVGALVARRRLRHKTRKQPFAALLFLIAGVQMLFFLSMLIPAVRNAVVDAILQTVL